MSDRKLWKIEVRKRVSIAEESGMAGRTVADDVDRKTQRE